MKNIFRKASLLLTSNTWSFWIVWRIIFSNSTCYTVNTSSILLRPRTLTVSILRNLSIFRNRPSIQHWIVFRIFQRHSWRFIHWAHWRSGSSVQVKYGTRSSWDHFMLHCVVPLQRYSIRRYPSWIRTSRSRSVRTLVRIVHNTR